MNSSSSSYKYFINVDSNECQNLSHASGSSSNHNYSAIKSTTTQIKQTISFFFLSHILSPTSHTDIICYLFSRSHFGFFPFIPMFISIFALLYSQIALKYWNAQSKATTTKKDEQETKKKCTHTHTHSPNTDVYRARMVLLRLHCC